MPGKMMYWLKLHTKGWLRGSIRFDLAPAERSVFLDLIALAREGRNPPWVQANETTPYPHAWLAQTLNISLDLLETTLERCKQEPDPRIVENEHGIYIVNFGEYQSEKDEALKPYRAEAKKGKYHAPTVGYIEVGGEELQVMQDQDGSKYFIDDKGGKVTVEFDDESGKYRAI